MRRGCIYLAVLIISLVSSLRSTTAAEQILVIVGQGAADLEHVAAQEMMGQLNQIGRAHV